MRLCDTCIYGSKTEYFKPCIIYRDDCEYYEREEDMTGEQAIKWLKDMLKNFDLPQEQYQTALDVAIKALEQEPKTGHWIEIAQYSDGKHKIECSECGSHIFDRGHANSFNVKNKYKYCPNCGARMVEPQESEDKE